MIRIIVTGGRDYADRAKVFEVLDGIHAETPVAHLSHGAAHGADTLADQWAATRDVMTFRYPADWEAHGKAAGPARNAQMAYRGADLVVAFPGGRGTADMVKKARAAGIPVREVDQ